MKMAIKKYISKFNQIEPVTVEKISSYLVEKGSSLFIIYQRWYCINSVYKKNLHSLINLTLKSNQK